MATSKPMLAVLFLAWYGFNLFYNISNKQVAKVLDLPWTLSACQMLVGLLYIIPSWILGMQKPPKLSFAEAGNLLHIAVLHAGGHLAAVMSMFAGAVSFTHIIKASEPVVGTLIGPLFGSPIKLNFANLCLLPIVGGVAFAAMKPGQGLDLAQLATYASAMAMASNVAFAFRGCFSKQVMTPAFKTEKNMTPSNTYAVLTIISCFILVPLAFVMEGDLIADKWAKVEDQTFVLKQSLLCGACYYAYNEMGYRVLGELDAVSTAVGNTIKRVVIMAGSVLLLGEDMNSNKLIGASVAVLGTLAYSVAKAQGAAPKAKAS